MAERAELPEHNYGHASPWSNDKRGEIAWCFTHHRWEWQATGTAVRGAGELLADSTIGPGLLTIHPFTLSNAYTLTAEVEAYAQGSATRR